jgi:hypothetical protein
MDSHPACDCEVCRKARRQRHHHVTGRGADGQYLDAELTAPVCHDDHELCHEDLRNADLDRPCRARTLVERVEYRLRRMALFFGRMAEANRNDFFYGWLARRLEVWANELARHVAGLDRYFPAWRTLGDPCSI